MRNLLFLFSHTPISVRCGYAAEREKSKHSRICLPIWSSQPPPSSSVQASYLFCRFPKSYHSSPPPLMWNHHQKTRMRKFLHTGLHRRLKLFFVEFPEFYKDSFIGCWWCHIADNDSCGETVYCSIWTILRKFQANNSTDKFLLAVLAAVGLKFYWKCQIVAQHKIRLRMWRICEEGWNGNVKQFSHNFIFILNICWSS